MRSRFSLAFAVIVFAAVLAACGGGGPPKPGPQPPLPPPPPPPPTVTQGDWYTYRHDTQRTGRSGVVGPQNPQILYSIPGTGEPVFNSENTAYICSLGFDYESSLAAVRDGEVLWALNPEEEGIPYSPTVCADGSVCVSVPWGWTDNRGDIRRYTHEGELLWRFDVDWSNGPTISPDGSVFFNGFISEDDGFALIAVTADGELRWQLPEGPNEFMFPQSIAPDGALLLTASFGVTLETRSPIVMKLNPTTGDVLWETAMPLDPPQGWGYSPSVPVIADNGIIYVADVVGVYAFSPQGEVLWSYYPDGQDIANPSGPTPWGKEWPPAIGPEGNIYLTLMEEMETYATALIALNSAGELLWRRDEHLWGPPIVDAAGTIYIASGDGETWYYTDSMSQAEPMEPRNSVLAINSNGTTKWEFSAPDELDVYKVLCMDNEGNLVVSGRDPDGEPWEERLYWLGDAQ